MQRLFEHMGFVRDIADANKQRSFITAPGMLGLKADNAIAEARIQEAINTRKELLGTYNRVIAASLGLLASIYIYQGRWKAAEELEEQVIQKRTRILEKEHSDTLESISNLATIYSFQGRWKKAAKLHLQLMKKRMSILRKKHSDTLMSMSNLISTYRA